MDQISLQDLKFYAAHALSGLSSNSFLMSPDGKLHLLKNKLTIEGIAINSALSMIEKIHIAKLSLDKMEEVEREMQAKNVKPIKETK